VVLDAPDLRAIERSIYLPQICKKKFFIYLSLKPTQTSISRIIEPFFAERIFKYILLIALMTLKSFLALFKNEIF
jgi:hypothetical protein